MSGTPRLFVIVGGPGSGKDDLIHAVRKLATRHASIVPKHTSRNRRSSDEDEMICNGDAGFALDTCDVTYESHGDRYGIRTVEVWLGLATGISQVAVVSQISGINALRAVFGELLVLVYVYSEMTPQEYRAREAQEALVKNLDCVAASGATSPDEYAARRAADYQLAFEMYVENILAFDHVLIASATKEDVYDQLFRLFRAYETGRVYTT